jgi:hypothetical protein
MKRSLSLLALLVLAAAVSPTVASSSVASSSVSTSRISRASPARYVFLETVQFATTASGNVSRLIYPYGSPARLVDVIVYQVAAGTGGTSYTVDVKNSAGTSLLATLSVSTLASGPHKSVDAKGELALPSGWTRPALKTDSTVDVIKGQVFDVTTVETGTYSPHATTIVALVFEPKQ